VIHNPGGNNQKGALKVYPDVKHHWSIIPQETVLGSPNPKKLNAASVRMAPVTPKVIYRNDRGNTLGAICLKMILPSLAPLIRADSMKGLSRRDRTCDRITLDVEGHPNNPIRMTMFQILNRPKAAPITNIRGILGKVNTMSAILCNKVSIVPPKYPETNPTTVPTMTEAAAAVIPTANPHLAPSNNWLNKSLPMKSVPMGCRNEGWENPIISGSVPYRGIYISSILGGMVDARASAKKIMSIAIPKTPTLLCLNSIHRLPNRSFLLCHAVFTSISDVGLISSPNT
jgi:hypothetical protein